MTYPFVQARFDYGPRKGPALAFVVHMAEGGGTVGFLSRDPARGVSVHYVIEGSGRTVRMLDESHASGSINPAEIRTTDDPDGFFGHTAAAAVMGGWIRDPNSAVISVELEGFAVDGPNIDQVAALRLLVADVASRYPGIRNLGHRDFQSVKRCPGPHIPWSLIGGHGGGDVVGLSLTLPSPATAGELSIAAGADAIRVSDGHHYSVPQAVDRPAYVVQLAPAGSTGFLVDLDGDVAHFIRASTDGVVFTAGDCRGERDRVVAAAVAALEAVR